MDIQEDTPTFFSPTLINSTTTSLLHANKPCPCKIILGWRKQTCLPPPLQMLLPCHVALSLTGSQGFKYQGGVPSWLWLGWDWCQNCVGEYHWHCWHCLRVSESGQEISKALQDCIANVSIVPYHMAAVMMSCILSNLKIRQTQSLSH